MLEVDETRAEALVSGGFAEYIERGGPLETATNETREMAVNPLLIKR